MTAILTVTCDRCNEVIDADRHLIEVASGSGRNRLPEGADLCPDCFTAWLGWLAESRQPAAADDRVRA